ncbi:MAG TPA: hypothetical protein VFF06_17390 [Polyangia bacterium]|nr:hypothetical protein [Polyangia bacterium]
MAIEPADKTKKAFDFAADVTKQIITLSTATIGLSVTFAKDIFRDSGRPRELLAAWLLLLFSIVFGVITLDMLSGTMQQSKAEPRITVGQVRYPSMLQQLLFAIGLGVLVHYTYTLHSGSNAQASQQANAPITPLLCPPVIPLPEIRCECCPPSTPKPPTPTPTPKRCRKKNPSDLDYQGLPD